MLLFRGSDGALVVFDVKERKTFEEMGNWIGQIRSKTPEGIVRKGCDLGDCHGWK